MNYLIGGEANDAIKSAINNALLSKKNPSTQKSNIKIPSKIVVKDNINNAASQVTLSNLQALSQNLGLYNSKGIVNVRPNTCCIQWKLIRTC